MERRERERGGYGCVVSSGRIKQYYYPIASLSLIPNPFGRSRSAITHKITKSYIRGECTRCDLPQGIVFVRFRFTAVALLQVFTYGAVF